MKRVGKMSMTEIEKLSTENLLSYHYHTKDEYAAEALLNCFKYKVKVKLKALNKSNPYYDDYYQEGMIGLYHAITHYNNQGLKPFIVFADLCIKGSLYNYYKHLNRKKHQILTCALPFDHEGQYETNKFYIPDNDISEIVVAKIMIAAMLEQFVKALSPLERRVWFYHARDLSYIEVSHQVLVSIKSVTNAIQRIGVKFKRINDKNKLMFDLS